MILLKSDRKYFITLPFGLLFFLLNVQGQKKDTSFIINQWINYTTQAASFKSDFKLDSAIVYAFKAKNLLVTEKELFLKKLGNAYYDAYSVTISALAVLHLLTKENELAFGDISEVVDLAKVHYGKESKEYAKALFQLLTFYTNLKEYAKAEQLLAEEIPLVENTIGKINSFYPHLLEVAGMIYESLRDDDKAEGFRKDALEIYLQLAETDPSQKKEMTARLAFKYRMSGDYQKADSLYQIVLKSREKEFGTASPDYALIVLDIAEIKYSLNKKREAESLFLKAMKVLGSFKENAVDYAQCLSGLADIYKDRGDYQLAEETYLKVKSIRLRIEGKQSLDFVNAMDNLVNFYILVNNKSKLAAATEEQINAWQSGWLKSFSTFSEKEKQRSINSESFNIEKALAVLQYVGASAKPSFTNTMFQVVNHIDGLLLQSNSRLISYIRDRNNKELQQLYDQWMDVRHSLANALQLTVEDQKIQGLSPGKIEEEISILEKKMLRFDPALEKMLSAENISIKELSRSLKPGQSLIKWLRFENLLDTANSIQYGAFVLKAADTSVRFVSVCHEDSLLALLHFYYNNGARSEPTDETDDGINRDSVHRMLYQLLWKPLLSVLGKDSVVYIIPSGQTHRVSFCALQNERNKFLSDQYQVHQLLNSSDLLQRDKKVQDRSLVLFGGVDFNSADTGSIKDYHADQIFSNKRDGSNGFKYLPGTLEEVNTIVTIMNNARWKLFSYSGTQASKTNFIRTCSAAAPSIIHLATHGFYFPAKDSSSHVSAGLKNKLKGSDYPLLRSGIVLSGVNRSWFTNSSVDPSNNGILTAQEIANMDLSHTDLVVLSACETALGDINHTEGVYGLQRGFKMAGVKKLIMSLWPVPDKETAVLMKMFYSNLSKGMSCYEAFSKAQRAAKELYPDPQAWAGFVLLGE